MRIALIDTTPQRPLYPLPLLKIGAWRQSLGDQVQLFSGTLPGVGEFDQIWVTTCFTFDLPAALTLVREAKKRAGRVWVGGISATLLPEYFEREGVEVHRGLLPEAEQFPPNYDLLGIEPEYSITHTSRGCIRKCKFCMVTRLESDFTDRPGWVADVSPKSKKILFYDNNWLAKPHDQIARDVESIRDLVKRTWIHEVDFNQGLDARLVTDEIVDLLQGLPIHPVRFAFDGMHEDRHYQRAVRMMASRGHRDFSVYVLYNFKDTPEDFYYRLRESVLLSKENGISVASFPMRYQPILDVDHGRDYVGDHWSVQMKKGFMAILSTQSFGGQVSYNDLQEFEYWFGRNSDEFIKLLNYPRIRELCRKKKGSMRFQRAQARSPHERSGPS